MSMNDSRPTRLLPAKTVTLTPDLANIIFPSLQLHQYRVIGILHKTQEAGRKYIFEICLFSISKFLLFLFLHISTKQRKFLCCRTNIHVRVITSHFGRVKLIKYIFRWDEVRTESCKCCPSHSKLN